MGYTTIMILASLRELKKKGVLDAYLASKGVTLEKRGTDEWWAIPNVGLPYIVDLDADIGIKAKELRISSVACDLNKLADDPD